MQETVSAQEMDERLVRLQELIDGQQAVLFLVKVKELMEDPASMLVD